MSENEEEILKLRKQLASAILLVELVASGTIPNPFDIRIAKMVLENIKNWQDT